MAIVTRLLGQQEIWRRYSHESSRHDWFIEVLLLLKAGAVLNDQMGALAESMCDPWQEKITAAIYGNHTLYGTVLSAGEVGGNVLYRSEIGQIDWLSKTFWGIRFVFPVTQTIEH